VNAIYLLGTGTAGEVKAGARDIVCDNLIKEARLPLKELKLPCTVKAIVNGKAGRVRQKIDHMIGVGIRERLEKHSVYHREDSCVGAYSESKRGYGGKG
jgi:hypothetical protein